MNQFQLPIYSSWITFLILLGIMIVRYFILAGGFRFLVKNRIPISNRAPTYSHIKSDVIWSLVSSFIFALNGTLLVEMWKAGWTKIELGELLPIHFVSLALYFIIHDTYFYFTHVWLHKFLFKFHKIHHLSRTPTAWTSFSFHPVEAAIQAIILPVLVFILPIHWTLFFFFLLMMSLFGVLNHLGYELYPKILERKFNLISASHHQKHHEDVNSNFGLYFTWWDKWLKTEAEERHGK